MFAICWKHSEAVDAGNIIIRQRGTKVRPISDGSVGLGKDHTIFACVPGHVYFKYDRIYKKMYVGVESPEEMVERVARTQAHRAAVAEKKRNRVTFLA